MLKEYVDSSQEDRDQLRLKISALLCQETAMFQMTIPPNSFGCTVIYEITGDLS